MKPFYEEAGITIYHGDCREILPQLGRFDLLLTDPPYGVGENAHRIASRTKAAKTTDYGDFDWDGEPASDEEMELAIASAKTAIIWGGNYFKVPPSRGWLVWDKQNSGNFADCELAWTNCKTSVRIFRFTWNGMIREGEWRGKCVQCSAPISRYTRCTKCRAKSAEYSLNYWRKKHQLPEAA